MEEGVIQECIVSCIYITNITWFVGDATRLKVPSLSDWERKEVVWEVILQVGKLKLGKGGEVRGNLL